MKTALRAVILKFKSIIDICLTPMVFLSSLIFYVVRRIGVQNLFYSKKLLKQIGVFPILDHYYEPLFNDKHLSKKLNLERNLPGIDFKVNSQLRILKEFKYSTELIGLELSGSKKSTKHEYTLNNGYFESGDAEYLYQLVRLMKPKKFVEIGSGYSTLLASEALKMNFRETKDSFEHICIEPYENDWLQDLENIEVLKSKIEDFHVDWNSFLNPGDILFIDSSHVIRPQGDVVHEYLEIIPTLKPGVIVHVHDIFTPRDYLKKWIVDEVRLWNEQYILEALLSHNSRYEVVGALNYLKHNHFDELKEVCPYLEVNREPCSFYFKIVHD